MNRKKTVILKPVACDTHLNFLPTKPQVALWRHASGGLSEMPGFL